MSGKHYCSIDFMIEGNVYYSCKTFVDSSAKPSKATVVVLPLLPLTPQTLKKKRRYPERNSQGVSGPQYTESSPDKTEEDFELNEVVSPSNDPDYEQAVEDSDVLDPEANVTSISIDAKID